MARLVPTGKEGFLCLSTTWSVLRAAPFYFQPDRLGFLSLKNTGSFSGRSPNSHLLTATRYIVVGTVKRLLAFAGRPLRVYCIGEGMRDWVGGALVVRLSLYRVHHLEPVVIQRISGAGAVWHLLNNVMLTEYSEVNCGICRKKGCSLVCRILHR